jgi:hypothetical protein
MARRKKAEAPPEPIKFSFRETLKDYFTVRGADKQGSRDYTRTMTLTSYDGDRVLRDATLDDLVEALRVAPWDVRDEFDR